MLVYVGLIIVSCLFLSFLLITSGVYLFIDKSGLACWLYCTKSSWRCIGCLPPALAYNLQKCTILQPMGSKGRYLKKSTKPCWAAKKLKNWPSPLFRPRTNHTCHQKPNPSREAVPLKGKTRLSVPASSPPVLRALGGWEEETRQQWAQAPSWRHGGERRHGPNCG